MAGQKEIADANSVLQDIKLILDNLITDLNNNKDFSDKNNYAKISFAKNEVININFRLTEFFRCINMIIDSDENLNTNVSEYTKLLQELIIIADVILKDKLINPPTAMKAIRKITDKIMSEKTKIGFISFLEQIPIISNLTGLINNLPYYWDRADKLEKACMAIGAALIITGFVTAVMGVIVPEFSPITTGISLSIVLLGYSIFTPALIGPMLNEKYGSLDEVFLSLNGLIAKARDKCEQLSKPILNQYQNEKTQQSKAVVENKQYQEPTITIQKNNENLIGSPAF